MQSKETLMLLQLACLNGMVSVPETNLLLCTGGIESS